MVNIVLIFLVFYITSSNFAVSLLLFAILVPQILLSFIGGVVADIGNRKTILVLGNLLRAGVLIILFFNYKSLGVIYLVTFLISAVTQFYVPAESPLIPSLVKRDKLVAANSIFGIGLFGAVLFGYVLAGPAISIFGRSFIFLILAGIFIAAGFFAFLIPGKKIVIKSRSKEPNGKFSIRDEFMHSFSLLRKTRSVGDAFFLLIFSQVVIFILATLIPGYARSILQIPAEELSLILFGPAALGMVTSALLIGSVFNKSSKDKLMNVGIFLSGITLVLLPATSRIFSQSIN